MQKRITKLSLGLALLALAGCEKEQLQQAAKFASVSDVIRAAVGSSISHSDYTDLGDVRREAVGSSIKQNWYTDLGDVGREAVGSSIGHGQFTELSDQAQQDAL